MNQGYLSRTWCAVKATKNWFGKICLLGLIAMIPVFGAIVVSGYLYGWARDAAWRMDNPMPSRIFGNEDGRLYKRGFFALVISVAFTLVISVGSMVVMWAFGLAAAGASSVFLHIVPDAVSSTLSMLALPSIVGLTAVVCAFVAVSLAAQFFVWVGTMRMSVYGTLSSGFQLSRIWAMIRRNPAGLVKIFLGQLAAGFLAGIVASVVWCVVVFVGVFASLFAVGSLDYSGSYGSTIGGLTALGVVATVVLALLVMFATLTVSVAIQLFVCRALGYWTADFDVAAWGSQDDPLPFESVGGGGFDARR